MRPLSRLFVLSKKNMFCSGGYPLPMQQALTRNFSAQADTQDVLLERISDKGVITLNRGKALNALSLEMIRKMYPELKKWDQDRECRLVITKTAFPGKAFCSGGDVKSIALSKGTENDIRDAFFREEYRLDNMFGMLTMPYVALLDGLTMGGGCGISMHGPFRVATENTLIAMPETAIGLFPDVGGSVFLSKLPGKLGMFLGLTGYRLKGYDVFRARLATHFCASGKLPQLEEELLRTPNLTLAAVDKILTKYQQQSKLLVKKELSLEPHMGLINDAFSASTVEDIIQRLRTRKTEFATKMADLMETFSPTSMKVTRQAISLGPSLTLQECLKMDFRIGSRMMEAHDFFEGVDCLLVKKSGTPQWKPKTLAEVTDEMVQAYFAPLPRDKELML